MKYSFFLLLLIASKTFSQGFEWLSVEAPKTSNFRGLSVVDDNVAWTSGSNGWIGRTGDGGKTWYFKQVKGFENSDFRSLYAFDSNTAVAANAGSPAHIIRTKDGGLTWEVVYTNEHAQAFIDGTDFWNLREGIMYGDPIEGRMLLLRTIDGGQTWNEVQEKNRPQLGEGEASFAASGTGIRCLPGSKVFIATGGKVSRLWTSEDKGTSWKSLSPPMLQGGTMTGIYSIAFKNGVTGIIVGGDYEKDSLRTNHIFYTRDAGKTWARPATPTRGLRECVEYISDSVVIAVGFPGSDISYDGGLHWQPLSDNKFMYVIRKARNGSLIIAAGGKGQLKRLLHKGQ